MNLNPTLGSLLLCALLSACGETGQSRIEFPLYGQGVSNEAFEVDGFTVQLTKAQVGIGPLYVCASARSSSDLCPSAVAELTSSMTVDALDTMRQRIGTMHALTGNARSVGFDYAITWPTSLARAQALRGAPEGHSAVFEGRAERADRSFDFHAEVDAAPALRGTRAVQGLPTRVDLAADVTCELELDPIAWWSQVDFEALSATLGDSIEIAQDSPAIETVKTAMTSNATPTITWSHMTKH
jgi:hypothetical protein